MDTHLLEPKIRAAHLGKLAFIYVRQSSLKQVQRNVGSTARQYDLALRARELGWQAEQIVVVDQDQARSGASSVHRTGFQHLVAEVGLGHAGAVLSLEASRLAQASSDWYRLLEICALTETLVIDEEGVYDPGQNNDRLLLGFKGTMSEAELHWLRSRLEGGKLELARQGKLRFHPPTGFVHDADGQLILDPDQAVQAAIQQVFDCFAECGTARGVVLYFRTHQLHIPTRLWGTARAGECVWRSLSGRSKREPLIIPDRLARANRSRNRHSPAQNAANGVERGRIWSKHPASRVFLFVQHIKRSVARGSATGRELTRDGR